jgi:hypothetical protein
VCKAAYTVAAIVVARMPGMAKLYGTVWCKGRKALILIQSYVEKLRYVAIDFIGLAINISLYHDFTNFGDGVLSTKWCFFIKNNHIHTFHTIRMSVYADNKVILYTDFTLIFSQL